MLQASRSTWLLWNQSSINRALTQSVKVTSSALSRGQQAYSGEAAPQPRAELATQSSLRLSQDRITPDGDLLTTSLRGSSAAASATPHPPGLPLTAPVVPPLADAQLAQLVEAVHSSNSLLVLTGAGCSTESSLPDYRGPKGAYSTGFSPMTHQKFMAGPEARARYWARSFAGWHQFVNVRANRAHEGLARLRQRGWVGSLITQNVDRLHQQAGTKDVLELHGTTHEVICLGCGDISSRAAFQEKLVQLNPEAAAALDRMTSGAGASTSTDPDDQHAGHLRRRPDGDVEIPMQRPDGDIELKGAGESFVVPPCPKCGGILKPDVVFFGDSIPPARSARAMQLASSCDVMLVVGSSLMVYSAFKLAKAAKANAAQLVIVTAGPTRADESADLKLEALAGDAMARLAGHPSLLLPRPYG